MLRNRFGNVLVYNCNMNNIKTLKILYMGTPNFSANLLEWLILEGFNIIGVVSKADAFIGRKKILTPSPVKEVALKYNLPVFTPIRIRNDYDFIVSKAPDLILTFAYGQIVPKAVLEASRFGCFNFHGSILPAYRGASPIQMALINNEKETGVSLMEMVEAMDAGRVFAIEKFPLTSQDNFKTVSEKMVEASKKLILNHLLSVVNGLNPGVKQDESRVTYAPILKPNNENISLETESMATILGKIRAFAPDIGVNLRYEETSLKLYEAEVYNNLMVRPLGELFIDGHFLVLQLKDGQIKLNFLQKSGKNRVDARSFINGDKHKLPVILKTRTLDE